MASKTADGVLEPTDQQTPDPATAGTDETPSNDQAVNTRNDDPSINPAPNSGPDAPTGDAAVEAFPDQDEIITSAEDTSKPKKSTQETTPSDQSGDVITIEVVEQPDPALFVARKTPTGIYRFQRQGWIGPEALEVADGDELKVFKKFVASL